MSDGEPVRFKLYIAGRSAKSERARVNLERIVKKYFGEDALIEVIDLAERPHLAREDQIVAIPTLVRDMPGPKTQIVGDLADSQRVLDGLGAIDLHDASRER